MGQRIDDAHPHLSDLVRPRGKIPREFDEKVDLSHKNCMSLRDCCRLVMDGFPRWAGGDQANYLATLNAGFRQGSRV